MPDIISPNSPPENSIVVQTRKGENINNSQNGTLSLWDRRQIDDLIRKHLITFRTQPSVIYNCHGMTFASRRTGICEIEDIYKILKDDDYTEIPYSEVSAGDIILYFSLDGDIEHSGIVISKPEPPVNIPQIVSKWGNAGEVVHSAYNTPYNSSVKYYRVVK